MIRLGPPNSVVHPLVKTILLSELIRKHLQQKQYSMLQKDTGLNQQFEYTVSRINMIEHKILSLKGNIEKDMIIFEVLVISNNICTFLFRAKRKLLRGRSKFRQIKSRLG